MLNPNDTRTPKEHIARVFVLGTSAYLFALFLLIAGQFLPMTPESADITFLNRDWQLSILTMLVGGACVIFSLAQAMFIAVLRWKILQLDTSPSHSVRRWVATLNGMWVSSVLSAVIAGFCASMVVGNLIDFLPISFLCHVLSFALVINNIYRLGPYFESIGRDYDDELNYRINQRIAQRQRGTP